MFLRRLAAGGLLCTAIAAHFPAWAQSAVDQKDFARRLENQERKTREQSEDLQKLRAQLAEIRARSVVDLDAIRAGQGPTSTLPNGPVGEKPQDQQPNIQLVTALPEGMNVLAGPGRFVFTPSVEYTRSASNRLVFRGVEIVPGLQLGVIDANTVAADTAAFAGDLRVGIFDRFELELRVPYYYRHNALTTVSQQVTTTMPPVTQTVNLEGMSLGDVELSARYQINAPSAGDEPIYIASLRVKSPTGVGPFDVPFDSSGVAQALPTGTGFWGAGPGITVIIPSDPAVLFGTVGYLHNFGKDINKTLGSTPVGNVEPGDSIDGALGFGLALNQRFSVSLGYAHSMIFPSNTMLGNTDQRSQTLQAGRITMGWSYQFSEHFTVNNNFEYGVTSDAPNLLITLRVPFVF